MDTWGYMMLRMFHGSMIFVEVGGITVFSSNIESIIIFIYIYRFSTQKWGDDPDDPYQPYQKWYDTI